MKLTKNRLRQIIREVIEEVNLYHDEKGHWTSKKTGAIRSLSRPAARRNNVDDKYVGKAQVANDKEKVRKKMGLSDCGSVDIDDGRRKHPVKSCKDFPKEYANEELILSEEDLEEEMKQRMSQKQAEQFCRKHGMAAADKVIADFLKRTNAAARATKGSLFNKGKG